MANILVSIYFGRPQLGHAIKINCINIADLEICSILTFYKRVWDELPHHIVYDFSRKIILILNSINWQISLSGSIYFLRYWTICTVTICFLVCDVINSGTNLSFLFAEQ